MSADVERIKRLRIAAAEGDELAQLRVRLVDLRVLMAKHRKHPDRLAALKNEREEVRAEIVELDPDSNIAKAFAANDLPVARGGVRQLREQRAVVDAFPGPWALMVGP